MIASTVLPIRPLAFQPKISYPIAAGLLRIHLPASNEPILLRITYKDFEDRYQ